MAIFEECLALRSTRYGQESQAYLYALRNSDYKDCLLQKYGDARQLENLRLEEKTVRKLYGDTSFFAMNVKWWIGIIISARGEQPPAVRHYLESLAMANRILEPTDPFFGIIYGSLRGQYIGVSSRPSLDSTLLWGLKERGFYESTDRLMPAAKRKYLAQAYANLVEDYSERNRYDSAGYYFEQSVELLDETNPTFSTEMLSNAMQALQKTGRPPAGRPLLPTCKGLV